MMRTRRMAELNLINKVSAVRRDGAGFTSSSQMKPVRFTAVRKCRRVASKEPSSEKGHIQPTGKPRRRRNSENQIPANAEARKYATRHAEELRSALGSDSPSVVKSMCHSHVKGSFWLTLPVRFCKSYLPKQDEYITLLDEDGNKSSTRYLAQQCGLSAGWRRFAIDHDLADGDALVFQVIQPTMLKVYIVRANDPTITESPNSENTHVRAKETDCNKNRGTDGDINEKFSSHDPPDVLQRNVNEPNPLLINPNIQPRSGLSVEKRGASRSSSLEDFSISGWVPDFDKFRIIVNGESIDHEFTKQARADYYNLCYFRKSYLHKNLPKSISGELAVGIITTIINMANAIRACKLSSSTDDYEVWEKTLVAYEQMGMDVGFIRDRLKRLVSLVSESRVTEELKRCEEARNKRDCTVQEIMSIETNLLKLKHNKARLEDEMVDIRVNLHRYESVFEEDASAPW